MIAIVSDHGFDAFPSQRALSGGHGHTDATVDGIYLFSGGPVAALGGGDDLSILDVTPTVLHLLGIPTPPYVVGRVATGIFDSAYQAAHPPRLAQSPVEPERVRLHDGVAEPLEAEAIEQLKTLGYLE